jgi:tetratricopeptide (TPR) repeat protein
MDEATITPDEFAGQYTAVFGAIGEIGRGYTYGGQPGAACQLFQNAVTLFDPELVPTQARLKLLIGYARSLITNLFVNHRGEETLKAVLAEAHQLAGSGPDLQAQADVFSLLGQADYFVTIFGGAVVDQEKKHYGPTFAYQQQGLAIREELPDFKGICESHFYLGLVHERWQEQEIAIGHYNKARELASQHNFYFEVAETSRHLAGIALAEGNLDRALENSLRELQGREQAGFKPYLPLDHLLLCDIYVRKGDRENAQAHAQEALTLAGQMNYAGAVALSRLRLGDIELKWGEAEKARAEYTKALEIAQGQGQTLLLNLANQRLAQARVCIE